MRLKLALTSLLILGLLTAAPLGAAGVAPKESPEAQAWRQAELYLAEGQGEKAYPIFLALLAKFPGHNALIRGRARAAALSGRRDEAFGLYNQLLAKFPGDPQLTAEARAVAGGGAAPAGAAETQVGGRFRLGFTYDSNANQGPASREMQLGSWQVNIPDAKKISTAAAYFGANFDILKPLDQSPWALVADAGLMWRGSANSDLSSSHSREWQFLRLAGGLRRVGERDLLDLRLKAEIFDYELTNNVVAVGPELFWLHALTPAWQVATSLGLEQRVYQRSSNRNGLYGQAMETVRFFFGDQGRHNVALGAGFIWGAPSEKNYQYTGWTAPLRLSLGLTDRLNLSPNLSYTQEFYRGPATALETKDRQDDRYRAGLDASYRLTESLTLEGSYAYTHNNSESPLYTYDQHLVSLGLAWGF
ncbi:MAG: surface lipoprotein assembly modifier [Candidatus Adiutrix sp.]|jgi:hypothetical protein|nr:surface lipoprotein assembly modifier [Candidatus Adiutrix sp.]